MANGLTNQASQEIRNNVVTDINANVPAPDPQAGRRVLSREAALLFNKSVVARPLLVPQVCDVHIKNLEYQYRWVNKGGRGTMYMQRRNQGFTPATSDDAEVLGGDAVADNGQITAGDVILMKIRSDLYDGAIKFNMEKSLALQRARGMYLKGASSDVHSDSIASAHTLNTDIPAKAASKAVAFIPDNPDALVSASALRGDKVLAEKQTSDIREKINAEAKVAKTKAGGNEE